MVANVVFVDDVKELFAVFATIENQRLKKTGKKDDRTNV